MEFVAPEPPLNILLLPHGVYGISYDIFIRKSEDDLPNGWHSPRARTYSQIIARLTEEGFEQHQYSDYRCEDTTGVATWTQMVSLALIRPPGKLQTTLRSLKMHYIQHLNEMDVTNQLQLGGELSPQLLGPTPVGLVAQVPDGLLDPVPVVPGPDFVRPAHTRPSAMADNRFNYRV